MGDPVDTSQQLAFDLPEVDAAIEETELPEVQWDMYAESLDPYLADPGQLLDGIMRNFNNPQGVLVLSSMFDDEIFDNDVDSMFARSEHSVYSAFATYQFIVDTLIGADWYDELDADTKGNIAMVMSVVYARLAHEAALWITDDEDEQPPFIRDIDDLNDLEIGTEWEVGGLRDYEEDEE